jgi:hypothetical protein
MKNIKAVSITLIFCLSVVFSPDVRLSQASSQAVRPLNITLAGQLSGDTYALAVQGNYVYLGVGPRLFILDVTDPASPTLVGQTSPLVGVIEDVVLSGSYAYIAAGRGGLAVVNIATPSAPVEVGELDTPGKAYGISVAGGYAYLADYFSGLRIINITNPNQPVEAGYYDTPGQAREVAVAGNYLYVAAGNRDLRVVDISNPTSPVEVGIGSDDDMWFTQGVQVVGTLAYVAAYENGVFVFDISNPTKPVKVGAYDPSGSAQAVTVVDNTIFVADGDGGLVILQVRDLPTLYLPLLICAEDYKSCQYHF